MKEEHKEWRLVGDEREKMRIPRTQDTGVMTEDMIVEQQQLVACLSASDLDDQVKQIRDIHHRQLLSDMSAFKAANPSASFPDFVRWHSPKDWLPLPLDSDPSSSSSSSSTSTTDQVDSSRSKFDQEDSTTSSSSQKSDQEDSTTTSSSTATREERRRWGVEGRLSARMDQEDNVWQRMWRSTRAEPVEEQKALFDVEKEAEKALAYLESLSPSSLSLQILLVSLSSIFSRLSLVPCVSLLSPLQRLLSEEERAVGRAMGEGKEEKEREVGLRIQRVERALTCAESLLRKFPFQFRLTSLVLQRGECEVETAAERAVVAKWFMDKDGRWGDVDLKEFSVSSFGSSSSSSPSSSSSAPHRLYASLRSFPFYDVLLATLLSESPL